MNYFQRAPRQLVLIVGVLLIGFALRLHGLGTMLGMVHYDEAYYGVDALSLIAQPRLTPFFPGNFGRESLWMTLLAPSLAVFGGGSFALRIVAIFTGTLTLAAVYRLARELLGRRTALPSMAALAVLFWHVLASHQAFRALLFPLVGALAFAFLWQARRTNQQKPWVAGGLFLGLLAYTYLAARVWLALAAIMLLVWLLLGRKRALLAGAIALIVSLPLMIYLLTSPDVSTQRIDQVAVTDGAMLLDNIGVWLRVPFFDGAGDPMYNLPGRALLDVSLALLFVAGLVGLVTVVKRGRALWLVLLVGASVAPALLTTEPLKWLRAIGLNVPLALVLGVGVMAVERGLATVVRWMKLPPDSMARERREGLGWLSRAIPVALLTFAAANTVLDFDRWLSSPDLFLPMEQHLYAGIDWLAENVPAGAPVYFSPFTADHPVLRLRQWRLGDRPVSAFEAVSCLAIPEAPEAYYFALTMYDPGFAERLGLYARVEQVAVEPEHGRYAIFRVARNAELFAGSESDFGGVLGARVLSSIPASALPGASVDVTFGLRALQGVNRPYTLFVHLYEGTALEQEIRLISQSDQPICPSDPAARWRPDEMIIQTYRLPIPAELAVGQYTLAFGIYDAETQARLPVDVSPGGELADYAVIGVVEVK